jgi:large subunit ribosomal protein L21
MSTAVIRSGGKQYRVAQGDTITVERLVGDPGTKVEFTEVLLVSGESPKVGKPLVAGAKVAGEILAQGRGEKITTFKYKRRKKYRRKMGHRQELTQVKITGISA